jgi:hypothetical protein|tara:strand:+ start:892 stop:1005 length:114 start_codon:yes stop_codon:yes gene_type:complete
MKIIEVMKKVQEFILGKEEKQTVKPKRKYRKRRVKKK